MTMTMSQKSPPPQNPSVGVRPAMRSAGVRAKTAPTSMSSTSETILIMILALWPSSSPTISGMLAPSLRRDIIPVR